MAAAFGRPRKPVSASRVRSARGNNARELLSPISRSISGEKSALVFPAAHNGMSVSCLHDFDSTMMLPLALFVLVCTLGHATSSAIPRAGRPGNDDTKVSKVVPPPIGDAALMARFIVNQADWTAVATISTRKDVPTFPVANVIALSDGALEKGSGVPYMFMTPLDYTAKDLAADNRATLLMTLAQGDYCKDKVYDPMDPRCARVMITGRIVEVKDDSELAVAKSAMFGRHPWLAHMPENHHFFFAKIDIATVVVLDTFGGPKYVTPEEYYNANPKPAAIGRPGRPFFAKPLTKGTDNDYPEPKFVYRV